jgi:hypothetical protein
MQPSLLKDHAKITIPSSKTYVSEVYQEEEKKINNKPRAKNKLQNINLLHFYYQGK